jgi:hypothetical protein
MRSVAMMVVPFLPSAAAEQQRRKKTGYGGSQKQRISIPIPFLLLQGSGAVHTSD